MSTNAFKALSPLSDQHSNCPQQLNSHSSSYNEPTKTTAFTSQAPLSVHQHHSMGSYTDSSLRNYERHFSHSADSRSAQAQVYPATQRPRSSEAVSNHGNTVHGRSDTSQPVTQTLSALPAELSWSEWIWSEPYNNYYRCRSDGQGSWKRI